MIIFQKNFRNKASFGTRPLSDQRKNASLKKKVSFKNFAIFQKNAKDFGTHKIDQNTNFAKIPSAKWRIWYNCNFYHSKIEK